MGLKLLFKDFEQRLVDTDNFSARKHTDLQNKECVQTPMQFMSRAKLVVVCDLDHNDQAQDHDVDGQEFTAS